jgi:hypothetical protein
LRGRGLGGDDKLIVRRLCGHHTPSHLLGLACKGVWSTRKGSAGVDILPIAVIWCTHTASISHIYHLEPGRGEGEGDLPAA